MKANKVMVIGLDGATLDLIRPWASAGHLPTLQELMTNGASGDLRSTVPPMTAPAWTSFMTGKNPGQHGLYDWTYRRQDSYAVSSMTASDCVEPTLWSLLSDAGRRVCAFNVPMTYPPQSVNGVMISGLPAPSTDVEITYPPELLAEIEAELGEYLLYPDPGQAYSDAGIDAFLRRLYQTTDMRLRVLDYLRHREDWHFLMVVFNGTDTVQHAMWKFMSPDHPLHEPRRAEKYGSAIFEYYQYIDQELGKIVASLDPDTVLILMSDHGFGPFHKFIHVNNWLRQHGWLQLKPGLKPRLKSAIFDLGFTPMGVYNLLMSVGMGYLKREVVRGRGQGLLKTLFLSFDDVDWSHTTAYSLGNVGQINLNVRGREPQGIVNPGSDYEKIRQDIIDRLQELRDPETGEHVIQEIYRREEIYWGDRLEQAADVLFVPTRMEYFGFGEYEFGSNQILERMKRGISGTHRMNGTLVMHGTPVKPGMEVKDACLYDLAPTILHLMGEPIPSDMDGQVLTEALTAEYADPSQVRYVDLDKTTKERSVTQELSAEDESTLTERLRNLGYVA
ncbi:MAG: alkaline phosphatase family protein [Chloroflexota bacterium]